MIKKTIIGALLLISLAGDDLSAQGRFGFMKGADVSFLQQIEAGGGVFYDQGIAKDCLQILKDHGVNAIRLRLWHTPPESPNSLKQTLLMAKRIKQLGMILFLDIHYSDSWADPVQQTKPAAWAGVPFSALKDSVYQYTKDVIMLLKNQGTPPALVQIGNEVTGGILWDNGKVGGSFDIPAQWKNFSELLNQGVRAVRESLTAGDSVKIVLHIDRGGDNAGSRWFFDHIISAGVNFDIIGLSYYPWWQGTLQQLESNLADLAVRYQKELMIVETAYPWTLRWFDNTQNIVGLQNQLLPAYPASVIGQTQFLVDELHIITKTPGGKGTGMFYWGPDWISAPGYGSGGENCALFDSVGGSLPSLDIFQQAVTVAVLNEERRSTLITLQNYPNPGNPSTLIEFCIGHDATVSLRIIDLLGREIALLLHQDIPAGTSQRVAFDGSRLSSGVYYCLLQADDQVIAKKIIIIK